MDGIAIKASITEKATELNPLKLYERKDFKYINTVILFLMNMTVSL